MRNPASDDPFPGPRNDPPGSRAGWLTPEQQRFVVMLAEHMRRLQRRQGPGGSPAPLPVDPRRPNTLSGGAAAPLEFD